MDRGKKGAVGREGSSRLLALGVLVAVLGGLVRAHAPHDLATAMALTPTFAEDQTVFGSFVFTEYKLLGRSLDGGRTWLHYGGDLALHEITAIRVSHGWADDRTVVLATLLAGVQRSTDGGRTFAPSNQGLPSLAVHDLLLVPGPTAPWIAATDAGLYRSTDRGETWQASLVPAQGAVPRYLDAGPRGVVYAAGDRLHRSTDGGASWQEVAVLPAPARALAAGPHDAGGLTLALGFGVLGGGVLASTDGGATLVPADEGLGDPRVNDLAFARDGTVFAATVEGGAFVAPGLGQPWTRSLEGLEELSDLVDDHYYQVLPSPDYVHDQTLFLGAYEGLFVSTDGGGSWSQQEIYNQRIHRLLAVSPDYARDGEVYVGNYGGGVWVWGPGGTRPPYTVDGVLPAGLGPPTATLGHAVGGAAAGEPRWQTRCADLGTMYAGAMRHSPRFAEDDTLYYAYSSLFVTADRGLTWTQRAMPPGVVIARALEVAPRGAGPGPDLIFMGTTSQGTWRSPDSAASWERLDGLPDVAGGAIVCSPGFALDQTVFLADKTRVHPGVFRSMDGGDTWSPAAGLDGEAVRNLELSPTYLDDGLVLAGTVRSGLYRSDDGGLGFHPVAGGLPQEVNAVVDGIAFSPDFASDGTLFVSFLAHGLYRSTDHASSFQFVGDALGPSASRSVEVSPAFATDGTVYHVNHEGLWRSTDRGESWTRLPVVVRADERHQSVVHQGTWHPGTGPTGSYGPGVLTSVDAGAATSYAFHGRWVRWHAATGPEGGHAAIFVDDVFEGGVDLYSPEERPDRALFHREFPEVGWHEVRVVNTGQIPPGSTGSQVAGDGYSFGG